MLVKNETNNEIEQAIFLISRLERLSADSIWAHRASGVRGTLLRSIDQIQSGISPEDLTAELTHLQLSIDYGYLMLENAARELIE